MSENWVRLLALGRFYGVQSVSFAMLYVLNYQRTQFYWQLM